MEDLGTIRTYRQKEKATKMITIKIIVDTALSLIAKEISKRKEPNPGEYGCRECGFAMFNKGIETIAKMFEDGL